MPGINFSHLPEPTSVTVITSGSHVVSSNKFARFHATCEDGGLVQVDGTTILDSDARVAIAASKAINQTGSALYTAPSNAYAIINAATSSATWGPNYITIGGQRVVLPPDHVSGAGQQAVYYVGPGQSVSTFTPGTAGILYISGVQIGLKERTEGWFRAPEAAVISVTGTARVTIEEYDKA